MAGRQNTGPARQGRFGFTSEPSPPHVAPLGEGGGLDDFRGHPGVGSRCAHLGGLVPLSGQPEISDLQRQAFHAFVLDGLSEQDWKTERQIVEGFKSAALGVSEKLHNRPVHFISTSPSPWFYATLIVEQSDRRDSCKSTQRLRLQKSIWILWPLPDSILN